MVGPMPRSRPNFDWQDDAACRDHTGFLDDGWTDKERRRVCNGYKEDDQEILPRCPVINECLTYALTLPATDVGHRGLVFGGFTGQQIAKKIRDNKRKNAGVR